MSIAVPPEMDLKALGTATRPTPRKRPLRIGMVVYSDYTVDSRVQRQARVLAERGDHVEVVNAGDSGEMRVGAGLIRLHPVNAPKVRGGLRSYLENYTRFFLRAFRRISRLELERRFDVVEIHNMPNFLAFTALLPKLRGAPLILNVHDTFPELFATLFERPERDRLVGLMRREELLSSRLADVVITVTEEARERLESRGVHPDKGMVVMNSPDEGVFGPPREPVELPTDGPLRLVYHGGISRRFGVESLIRAIGIVREIVPVRLEVYGSFKEVDRLTKLARQVAPDHIHIAPRPTPFAEIPDKVGACHVGVVPTLQDSFTELLLPVKLLEYVHLGLPSIASRLPVMERYFADDEVLFYEPGSPEALADAIVETWSEPEKAVERAARASRRLGEYRWSEQSASYLEMIDALTGTASGGNGETPATTGNGVAAGGSGPP